MRKITIVAALLAATQVHAGIWSPPIFRPQTHADGSQTFYLSVALTKHHPQGPDKAEQITATFLAQNKFCANGWEFTTPPREEGKRLIVEGRCKN